MLADALMQFSVIRAEILGVVLGSAQVKVGRWDKESDEKKSSESSSDATHWV